VSTQIVPLLRVFPFLLMILAGCTAPASKKFSSETVHTYAELLALHEKEKIVGSTPDTVYRRDVADFFSARKINEEEFQKEIADISHDDLAWKEFLTKSQILLDSMRTARTTQH
jgi:hypothetical protein